MFGVNFGQWPKELKTHGWNLVGLEINNGLYFDLLILLSFYEK